MDRERSEMLHDVFNISNIVLIIIMIEYNISVLMKISSFIFILYNIKMHKIKDTMLSMLEYILMPSSPIPKKLSRTITIASRVIIYLG